MKAGLLSPRQFVPAGTVRPRSHRATTSSVFVCGRLTPLVEACDHANDPIATLGQTGGFPVGNDHRQGTDAASDQATELSDNQRVSVSRASAARILFSDTGPDVPSTWAKRLTRSSSIIQRTDWTSVPERGAAGSCSMARW